MDKEDDDDDEKAVVISRYPVMPSLASLRLMRNRLHLAYLGKKLMKWTAISTGRELRKLASQVVTLHSAVLFDMREAYIMLARSRYFFPSLNQRVIENCPPEANITVGTSVKVGAGVKMTKFDIREAGIDGYQHLGIEKGGQCIKETKEIWANLLKKIIMLMQYKIDFQQVDAAHKNATKRVNVLQRVHIPRICMTIRYILTELDEQEREEMFRLKRFKEAKKARGKAPETPAEPEVLLEESHVIKTQDKMIKIIIPETKLETQSEVMSAEPEEMSIEPEIMSIESEVELIKPEVKPLKPAVKPIKEVKLVEPKVKLKLPVKKKESKKRIPKSKSSDICIPCQRDVTEKISEFHKGESDKKLELLKKHLRGIIVLSKEFLEKGFKNANVLEFVSTCKEAQQKIEQFVEEQGPQSQVDKKLNERLEHLKSHLREVIDVTREFCEGPSSTISIESLDFNPYADVPEEKSPCSFHETISQPCSAGAEGRMEGLRTHIDEIVKLTEDYKKEGLLSASVEAFLTSCEHVKSKINVYAKDINEARNQRLDLLSKRVTFVEELANLINHGDMKDFLCSCKDFKGKLNEYKDRGQQPPTEGGLSNVVKQVDRPKEMSQEKKNEGLESDSMETFLKTCDGMRTHTESKRRKGTKEQPRCIKELKLNIDDIMNLVSKCRAEGSISESAEAFMKSCENAKAKIDVYGKHLQANDRNEPILTGTCSCSASETAPDKQLFSKCEGQIRVEPITKHPQPCHYCDDDNHPEKVIRNTCLQDPFNEVDWLSWGSGKPPAENTCELCKKSNEKHKEDSRRDSQDGSGYFKVVTKIKRVQNIDGSVREERKTITIRDDRNDHLASMVVNGQDEHDFNYSHDEAFVFDDKKKVNTCIASELNQSGFTRHVKKVISEKITSNAPMTVPCSRQCISLDNLLSINRTLQSPDNFSIETSDFLLDLKESCSMCNKTLWKDKPSSSKYNH